MDFYVPPFQKDFTKQHRDSNHNIKLVRTSKDGTRLEDMSNISKISLSGFPVDGGKGNNFTLINFNVVIRQESINVAPLPRSGTTIVL